MIRIERWLPARVIFWLRRQWRLVVFSLAVAFASGGFVGVTVFSLAWMEKPEFCTLCHTMQPQLVAYEQSPHRAVECAKCHISEGLMDLVEAKLQGSLQLLHLVTNTYERPIPPAGEKMKKGAENCAMCHREAPSDQDRLVLRRSFQEDEQNTERKMALVVRVADAAGNETRGVHWHITSRVEYLLGDRVGHGEAEGGGEGEEGEAQGREVSFVRVTEPSGEVKEYLSKDAALSKTVAELRAESNAPGALKQVDCLSCHNRAGHEFLPPSRALDDALASGRLDRQLPYIKKKGMELLTARYASTADAMKAIGGLESYYRDAHPQAYAEQRGQVHRAVETLRDLYPLVAIPEMKATYKTYPSLLGHRDTAGCLRCHGGQLVRLNEAGKLTEDVIPARCSLCHTFPQSGESVPQLVLEAPPASHSDDRLWIAEHKQTASSTQVGQTTCVACHSQNYCSNCHSANIEHADMLFNHAEVIRDKGTSSCTLCHQQPSCARCHSEGDVLESGPEQVRAAVLPAAALRRSQPRLARQATRRSRQRRSHPSTARCSLLFR